ncbi:MAG: hypothetical protein COB75_05685 [Idiomarina sp.]|nr:hypothetical protein [Idiomarina sp.]PHQ76983.1 MAG: hypothetical protein COB75_05685 [Idiomarina sp.]
MLINPNSHLYVYVIARDFGFAPNPFFGSCTLATCKPGIRKGAQIDDWVLGVAGRKLGRNLHRKCILLMKVTEKMSFQEYWNDERFELKKPCRNGSLIKMVGDNIYHKDEFGNWQQEDSHHSLSDGTTNRENLRRDTGSCEEVLVSEKFLYFGNQAVEVDLESINYKTGVGFKKISLGLSPASQNLISNIYRDNRKNLNMVISDPCQFEDSFQRVDQVTGKLTS